ncbi:MAG: AMP-binding protein [Desulfamplus sp.]|nr:AMP-binding protein [Desulfamplus sp.]
MLIQDNDAVGIRFDFPGQAYASLQYACPGEIRDAQTRLFLKHLHYIAENSGFYRRLFKENRVDINKIRTPSDITALPLTEKKDLGDSNAFLCVGTDEIVDVSLTSATTGSLPTVLHLTSGDLARLAYNEEIAFAMTGITQQDTLLICAALDRCFMAGIAYFLGGVKLKSRVVRSGSGSVSSHWELIRLTGATAVVGVPSLIYKIGRYALDQGDDPAKAGVKRLIAIGEPTKDPAMKLLPLARDLENMWGASIFSTYASSEIATTFCECTERCGGHLRPELGITEILDDAGEPVSDGSPGEVVVTPLGVTGMPLIRFKTGDISFLIDEKCRCGRTTKRIAPVLGRKNQMLKYKGTTVFPNAVIGALEGDPRFHGGYVEAFMNQDGTDRIVLNAAIDETQGVDWMKDILRARVRVVPEIKIIDRNVADRRVYQFDKKRKRVTFFDLRQK